jgi:hypothetical protein
LRTKGIAFPYNLNDMRVTQKRFLGFLTLLAIATLALFSACTQEKVVDVNPVCFERDILPLLVSSCTQSGCHNSRDRAAGVELTSYQHVIQHGVVPGNYKASELYKVLISVGEQLMPQAPYNKLSVDQITTIALWIEQGAKNTTCTTTTCDLSAVTYSKTVKTILDRSCNSCHSGNSPSGGINLSTYTGVKKYALAGSLYGSVNHDVGFVPMPENGKLPACEISSIKEWIRLGALNN